MRLEHHSFLTSTFSIFYKLYNEFLKISNLNNFFFHFHLSVPLKFGLIKLHFIPLMFSYFKLCVCFGGRSKKVENWDAAEVKGVFAINYRKSAFHILFISV